ncbi:hypothetical protein [Aquimarina longa]|uniref:hypothetical protein n=1 Tax=Aquimarina longa TaxID=1080221 RepID=UPI0007818D77|nr:hypothetical protein [Aquimarina longa]
MKKKEALRKVEKKSLFLSEKSKTKLIDQINLEIVEELQKESKKKEQTISRLFSDLTLKGYKTEVICNIILTPIFSDSY